MKQENLKDRVNELEKGFNRLSKEKSEKSKISKGILTSVLIIERIWRIIKHSWIE